MIAPLLVQIAERSVRKCGRCGGGVTTLGVMLIAALTSACTAAGMSRLQASQRTAVAVCGAAEAMRAGGADKPTVEQAEGWCRAAMRLAAAETTNAAATLEQAIQASDDAGLPVPHELRTSQDAGAAAPAGVVQ